MRKNLLWMMAAILFCGLTAVSLSSCGDDDNNDGNHGGGTSTAVGMKVKYYVKVNSQATLDACDVTVEYTGANGKQTQTLTSLDAFSPDAVIIKGIPNEAELNVIVDAKSDLTAEKYDVDVTYGAGACAVDAKGKEMGSIDITTENILSKGIRLENRRTTTRRKLVTISDKGEVKVN